MNAARLNTLVNNLTGPDWTIRTRNVVAHHIASMRGQPVDEEVTHRLIAIARQGAIGKYDQHRAALLRVVAEALGCSTTLHSKPYFYQGRRRQYYVTVFGLPADIDTAVRLYTALLGEATAKVNTIVGSGVATRRRTFFRQFVSTVSTRLEETTHTPTLSWAAQAREASEKERVRVGCESLNLEYA